MARVDLDISTIFILFFWTHEWVCGSHDEIGIEESELITHQTFLIVLQKKKKKNHSPPTH